MDVFEPEVSWSCHFPSVTMQVRVKVWARAREGANSASIASAMRCEDVAAVFALVDQVRASIHRQTCLLERARQSL
jgi:ribosomal 50S subunit-associated protein YjgA (DUF615 family)